jgi:uncharacterized membrane protein
MLGPVLRGKEASRIEGFSDAVFGFALTLLVVSLEVPQTFNDLRNILVGFPAFAVTFALICWVWYEHYLFFRHYDLEDGLTVTLNCILLFIVVFYAYPLKFVFTRLITGSLLGLGPGIADGMTSQEGRVLMTTYSAGFVALFATFALLHWNAWRQRERLGLDVLRRFDTRASVGRHCVSVAIGVASLAILLLAPAYFGFSGLIYFLLGPSHFFYGFRSGRRRERLETSLGQRSGTPPPETNSAGESPG